MKSFLKSALALILCGLLTSCMSTSVFYQIYSVNSTTEMQKTENRFVFENEECAIHYNMWRNGGNGGFLIENKTDEYLYVDLTETFFVKNQMAECYFKEREFESGETYGHSSATSVSTSVHSKQSGWATVNGVSFWGYIPKGSSWSATVDETYTNWSESWESVSERETEILVIPPRTMRYAGGFTINSSLLRYRGMYRNPRTMSDVLRVSLTHEESPVTFGNVIVYRVGQEGERKMISNEFYIDEVFNIPKSEMTGTRMREWGNGKAAEEEEYYKYGAPNRFFLRYTY